MSSNQNPFNARIGQAEVVRYQRAHPECKVLPVKLPGGYGKTEAIALSYNDKRFAGQVDRLLIVVANDVQLRQIKDEFAGTCCKVGFEIPGGVFQCDSNYNFLGASQKDLTEVFVTTIQRVSTTAKRGHRQGIDVLSQLLSDGHKWMLAADEFHHYGSAQDWGRALQRLVRLAAFTIATSATPSRDNDPTIFGKPEVEVLYRDAVLEKAVKEIKLHYFHYLIVVEDVSNQQTIELTTAQLRDEIEPVTGQRYKSPLM